MVSTLRPNARPRRGSRFPVPVRRQRVLRCRSRPIPARRCRRTLLRIGFMMRSFSDPGWDADRGVRIAGGMIPNKEGGDDTSVCRSQPWGLARLPGAIVRHRPLTVVRVVLSHGPLERVYTSPCRSNPFAPLACSAVEIYQARFVCCRFAIFLQILPRYFQIRRVQNTSATRHAR